MELFFNKLPGDQFWPGMHIFIRTTVEFWYCDVISCITLSIIVLLEGNSRLSPTIYCKQAMCWEKWLSMFHKMTMKVTKAKLPFGTSPPRKVLVTWGKSFSQARGLVPQNTAEAEQIRMNESAKGSQRSLSMVNDEGFQRSVEAKNIFHLSHISVTQCSQFLCPETGTGSHSDGWPALFIQ